MIKVIRHKPHLESRVVNTVTQAAANFYMSGDGEYTGLIPAITGRLCEKSVKIQELNANGVPCKWFLPERAPIDRAVVYLHGGAYAAGSVIIDYTASHIAARLGVRVFAVDYRLSGEACFPAALEDSITAYRWLLGSGAQGKLLVLMGDSAGGGLALATAMSLRDTGEDMPSSLVLVSPWSDLLCSGASYDFVCDNVLRRSWLLSMARKYAGTTGMRHEMISPLYGDMNDLPPTMITAGTGEVLLSDSVELAKRLDYAHNKCELHLWDGMFHNFPVIVPFLRDSAYIMRTVRSFVKQNMPECEATKKRRRS